MPVKSVLAVVFMMASGKVIWQSVLTAWIATNSLPAVKN